MTCFHGVTEEDGSGGRERIGVVRGKELGSGLTAEPSVNGRVPLQVIDKAAGHILTLGNELYVRGRVGANLIK